MAHRVEDKRLHGRGDNATHTVSKDENDQLGDKRHLRKRMEVPGGEGSRIVPIAETTGGDLKKKNNGGGKRVAPASMMKAGV